MWIVLMNLFTDIFCQPSKIPLAIFIAAPANIYVLTSVKMPPVKEQRANFLYFLLIHRTAFYAYFKLARRNRLRKSKIMLER